MKDIRIFTVSQDDNGQRLDRWMKRHVPDIPFGLAQKLIRTGQIRIDGKRVKADTKLIAGTELRLPPYQQQADKPANPKTYKISAEDRELIERAVIYDDGDILAINKPAGLATQGGTKIKKHVDGLIEALANEEGIKPRIVHRLDKDTSGVLLLARSAEMARKLGKMFAGRDMRKIYWAITVGVPEEMEGEIKASLKKMDTGPDKERVVIDEKEGQWALTAYEVVEWAGKQAAFVAFWPKSGRTHQIRVHAADALGCPLLGDRKYGGAAAIIEGPGIAGRLQLHARELSFSHPQTGKKLTITAPLQEDMEKTFAAFGFDKKGRKGLFIE